MSKRLQVLIDDERLESYQKQAEKNGLTLAAWVRRALRVAYRKEAQGDPDQKLSLIRSAYEHAFPVSDIEDMLQEIASGYHTELPE